jgi:hypothetical protein
MKSLFQSILFVIATLVWAGAGNAAVAVDVTSYCDIVADKSDDDEKEGEEEPDCE